MTCVCVCACVHLPHYTRIRHYWTQVVRACVCVCARACECVVVCVCVGVHVSHILPSGSLMSSDNTRMTKSAGAYIRNVSSTTALR